MEYNNLDKRVPLSFEAEQSVLGAILIKPDCYGEISMIIQADDFYIEDHRSIYSAITLLAAKSGHIDYVTVSNALVSNGTMSAEDAKEAIGKIIRVVPSAANAIDYAKIVKDRSLRRNLINICQEVIESAQSETDNAENILESAEKKVYSLSNTTISRDFRHISEVIITNYHELEKLHSNPEIARGVQTGFKHIDNYLIGMEKGDFVLIGARPGIGKTSFAMNIATRMGKTSSKAICVFSLEMSAEQLVLRMLASEAMIDSTILRSGKLSKDDWSKLADASSSLSNHNILIDDTPGISVTQMKSKLRRIKNLGFVIIDYLQLMQSESRNENRAVEVGDISRSIKLMAKEFGVPVLTCAQLNRAVESRKDGVPQLSDLRDSGSIEQDADSVMFLHRKEGTDPIVQVIIAKNRHGATGTVDLNWSPQFTTFYTRENQIQET